MGNASGKNAAPAGAGPRAAWTTEDGFEPAIAPSSLGTDGADSDSDVEYDASMLACPTPAVEALESDASAGSADMLGSMLGSAEDASMPSWAAGGAADEPCSSSLELQFVYGVRAADCRRNVFFTASGEVAFHSASLVVLYEPKRHTQRFLRGHDGEVRCLALHPTGRVLASGQAAGGRTEICVWQLDASEPAILSGSHAGGVCALAFSPTGDRLASLGADSSLVLWDWKSGSALASKSAHGEPLFALAWSPVESMLATVGVRCVKLWAVDADGETPTAAAPSCSLQGRRSSFPLE